MRFLLLLAIACCLAGSAQAESSGNGACPFCGGGGCLMCGSLGGGDSSASDTTDNEGDDLGPIAADGPPTYRITGGQWPQPGGDGTPVTVTYSYNNLLDGGLLDPAGDPLPADFLRESVEEALNVWASVVPINFVEVPDEGGPVSTRSYPDGQFGQIRFSHRYINGPDPPVGNPIAKALAWYPGVNNNLAGDVHYDNADRWQEVGTTRNPDILGATVHELGHTLGLGHDTNPDANMYWIFTRTAGPGTGTALLHPSDIAGVQSIYGAGVGSVTPLVTVPEPGAAMLAAMLLFACQSRLRPTHRR
ncbi:MAG: matrixin family metalloprotease [Planctomycetota bacterium]